MMGWLKRKKNNTKKRKKGQNPEIRNQKPETKKKEADRNLGTEKAIID